MPELDFYIFLCVSLNVSVLQNVDTIYFYIYIQLFFFLNLKYE